MQIETKFNPGNIVFFYNDEENRVIKGIVDKVRTFTETNEPSRIIYQIGIYDKEEDDVADTITELHNKMYAKIDWIFKENNIHDYALEQLAQF
jgi:hypothetical protein